MRFAFLLLLPALTAATPAPSSFPEPGMAEGRCRAHEPGPAILITAEGLKDRTGSLRAELYPPDQADFLADDHALLDAGKTFRRVIVPVPAEGPVQVCIRAPASGTYTLALTHDRDARPKFNLWKDGIGFPGNPKIGRGAPPASAARIAVGGGITQTSIVLNYRRGLLSFGPVK